MAKLMSLDNLAKPFVKLVQRFYPDAFLFVIILSVLTYFLAILFTDSSPLNTLEAWGNGLPKLFTFTAQISIIMITAHALAHTDPIEKLLNKIGAIPNTQIQAYAIVTFVAFVLEEFGAYLILFARCGAFLLFGF